MKETPNTKTTTHPDSPAVFCLFVCFLSKNLGVRTSAEACVAKIDASSTDNEPQPCKGTHQSVHTRPSTSAAPSVLPMPREEQAGVVPMPAKSEGFPMIGVTASCRSLLSFQKKKKQQQQQQ